jgi:glycosyltransferase involved in cell wall biosynthesis
MKVGIIARADNTGLGNQSLNLCKMLKPDKVMVVDSTPFNKNKQHFNWYQDFDHIVTSGWPTIADCREFANGLTHIFSAETMYNNEIYNLSSINNIKTYLHTNYEFFDQLVDTKMPSPYYCVMPSYWKNTEVKKLFKRVEYLPPPIFMNEFKSSRDKNLSRKNNKRRYLHMVGKRAINDRNGTLDLIKALQYSASDFELVIKSQHELSDIITNDKRITFDTNDIKNVNEMYEDFDAMILPRRYGGLCLPMNEALACGLPVIMTDTSPNNEILPDEFLVKSEKREQFIARTMIQTYSVEHKILASIIDNISEMSTNEINNMKVKAVDLAYSNFSSDVLKNKYEELFKI